MKCALDLTLAVEKAKDGQVSVEMESRLEISCSWELGIAIENGTQVFCKLVQR